MIDTYKPENPDDSAYSYFQENIDQFSIDPLSQNENIPDGEIADITSQLAMFLTIFDSQNYEAYLNNLSEIGEIIQSHNIDELSIQMFRENDIGGKLISIMTSPPSNEIYSLTLWIISLIFGSLIEKYKNVAFIEIFHSLDLLNFLITKFDPEFPEHDTPQPMLIPEDEDSLNLIPYYLKIFASYCLFDKELRNYLLAWILIPNLSFFFDDFENSDLVEQASLFIKNTTFFSLSYHKNNQTYINSLFVICADFDSFNSNVKINFLNAFYNILRKEQNIVCFWAFRFDAFLGSNIHKILESHVNDKLNHILLIHMFVILKLLLEIDPTKITLNYLDLLMYLCSDNPEKYTIYSYELFIQGLELQQISVLTDDNLYQMTIEALDSGPFHLKYKIGRIIELSMVNLPNRVILAKSVEIMEGIAPILLSDTWNENCLIILNIIEHLLSISQNSNHQLHTKLLDILGEIAVSSLQEMLNDEHILESHIPKVSAILQYYSSEEPTFSN